MTIEELWETLRNATEDDVSAALVDTSVQLPITTPVELLEAFNCILDQLTMERDAAEMFDDEMIAVLSAAHKLTT